MEINISNKSLLRVLVITALFIAFVGLLLRVQQQLVWLAVAGFLALALEPGVSKLSRFMPYKSRALALSIVFIAFISLFSVILINLVPPAISQATQAGPELINFTEDTIRNNPSLYEFAKTNLGLEQILDNKEQIISSTTDTSRFLFSSLGSILASLTALFTILLFTFLLILEGPDLATFFWKYQHEGKKDRREKLLGKMYGSVTGFVNGTLIRCGISGLVTMITLSLVGIPYAISLGLLIAFLGVIPMVGGLLGAALIVLVAFIYGGFTKGIIILIFFLIYSAFENYILQPMIFKKSVNVSPLVTSMAAIFGIVAGGFVGALIAIPTAASVQILLKDYLENR